MLIVRFAPLFVSFHSVALLLVTASAFARADGSILNQIKETIVTVRTAKTVDVRANATGHLADLARKIDPFAVDDRTFADLVSLMDSRDDVVRANVAATLGFLGGRAKPAVPKLLETLPKVDCLNGAVTSADAIRLALKRIGVTPPRRPDCERFGG